MLCLKHKKDKLNSKWVNNRDNVAIKEQFDIVKRNYNKQYREKITEFFATKSTRDFKNSKKFWSFYSSQVKLKSDGNSASS